MLRTLDLVLILAMVAAATVTYKIKHAAEIKQDEVRALQAQIKAEHTTIDLLQADWSLLNQPSRLQRLSNAFQAELGLEPISPQQMAPREELPGRASDFETHMAEGDVDKTLTTGSVGQ